MKLSITAKHWLQCSVLLLRRKHSSFSIIVPRQRALYFIFFFDTVLHLGAVAFCDILAWKHWFCLELIFNMEAMALRIFLLGTHAFFCITDLLVALAFFSHIPRLVAQAFTMFLTRGHWFLSLEFTFG